MSFPLGVHVNVCDHVCVRLLVLIWINVFVMRPIQQTRSKEVTF